SGDRNVAIGDQAGLKISSGTHNVCLGRVSQTATTTGSENVSMGCRSLESLVDGDNNVAIGHAAGGSVVSGSNNVFIGESAGSNATGSNNIFIGNGAGNSVGTGGDITGGDNNVVLGNNSNRYFYLPGMANNSAYEHGVDTNSALMTITTDTGQLGLDGKSSARYKDDIKDMKEDVAEKLLQLRPVTFVYKGQRNPTRTQYGLIAEEVDQILPEIVCYKDGQPDLVMYHKLPPLLLNAYQGQERRLRMVEAKAATLNDLAAEMEELRATLALHTERIDALVRSIGKSS
ncbi:hypothetical protein EBZ39_13375, partial [bacterium]|nr:hypothetical protein [bacterium]